MYQYEVNGMSCRSCVNHIEQAIKRHDPAGEVQVLLREGIVRVHSSHSLEHVKEVIEAEGYGVLRAEEVE